MLKGRAQHAEEATVKKGRLYDINVLHCEGW